MNMNTMRGSASRTLSRFLITFCAGVAATLAWWYGHTARQMIANSHPLFGWLAPAEPVAQNAPDVIALAAPATPSFDHQQLSTMSLDLDAVQQSIDRIAAGQEQISRSIDQIATTIAGGQELITRSIDQIATSREQTTRSTGQTSTIVATGKEQMMPSIDQTATNIGHDPSAPASGIPESRDGASPPPAVRLNIKPTEARPPQTLSERGKQFSASGHDSSCLPSASAVLQNHPAGRPSWTLRAPGHEGTKCWYAATRSRASEPSQ
jgi:hypothetical protein